MLHECFYFKADPAISYLSCRFESCPCNKEAIMPKTEMFPFRMSTIFKKRIKNAAEKIDMNMTEYIRLAIAEKLVRDGKD